VGKNFLLESRRIFPLDKPVSPKGESRNLNGEKFQCSPAYYVSQVERNADS
jgi:hypothetical protein